MRVLLFVFGALKQVLIITPSKNLCAIPINLVGFSVRYQPDWRRRCRHTRQHNWHHESGP